VTKYKHNIIESKLNHYTAVVTSNISSNEVTSANKIRSDS